jgi:hypothetical protein
MSWSSIGENQTVTFNNLLDALATGQLVGKAAFSPSQKCITKSEADTYLYIDTSYPPYASKASNQLVVKEDLVTYSQRIYGIDKYGFSNQSGGLIIYSDNGGLDWPYLVVTGGSTPGATSVSRNVTGQYVLYGIENYASASNNFGVSFTSQDLPGSVYTVGGTAISNSGDYMFAIGERVVPNGSTQSPAPAICRSTDYGASWSLVYTYPRAEFQYVEYPGGFLNRIATSGNGQYVLATWGSWTKPFATDWGCSFMRSTDYGVSFSRTDFNSSYITDVAVSNTGQYQIMSKMSAFGSGNVKGQGALYWSNNYGAGFATKIYEENYRALYCAMSASGQHMLVAYMNNTDSANKFYFSTDFGVNWGSFNTNPTPPLTGPQPGGVYVAPDGSYALITYAQKSTSETPWLEITYTINFENWVTIPISQGYNFGGLNKSR